jgi:hypothetical protein
MSGRNEQAPGRSGEEGRSGCEEDEEAPGRSVSLDIYFVIFAFNNASRVKYTMHTIHNGWLKERLCMTSRVVQIKALHAAP